MGAAVRIGSHQDLTVVAVAGELDVLAADCLRRRLGDLVQAGSSVLVVDLTAVTFIDSTGLGVLVGAHKRITKRHGRILLVVDQEPILKVLRVSALSELFTVHRTLEQALATA